MTVLDGPFVNEHGVALEGGVLGADLYTTEAAVEEFALQSLAQAAGLRWAQLSDFGPSDELGNALDAPDAPPLTKTERREPPATPPPAPPA